jgi:DNA-binding GntR family transcriptional regulator
VTLQQPSPIRHISSPIREQTVETIRAWIMEGVLVQGDRLIEREMCEQLGVSRNTLREAFRQLEAEGFVEMRPHRGPTVRRITPDEARQLYELREALEGLAIRLFTERASEQQLTELSRAYDDLAAAHASGDVASMLAAKTAFYAVLYAGVDNEALRSFAQVLQGRLAQLRARSLSAGGRPGQSIEEIAEVMALVKARDAHGAEASWCRHIRRAFATVSAADEQHLTEDHVTTNR